MKQLLTDYLEICLKYRKEYLSKPERKQRYILLAEWAKAQYAEENPTIPELYEFWDKYKDVRACLNFKFAIKRVFLLSAKMIILSYHT